MQGDEADKDDDEGMDNGMLAGVVGEPKEADEAEEKVVGSEDGEWGVDESKVGGIARRIVAQVVVDKNYGREKP